MPEEVCELRAETESGELRVWRLADEDGRAMRVLEVDGTYESATYLDDPYELPFAYLGLYDLMFAAPRAPRRALMMGGGGFAYPKHVLRAHPELSLDVVEPDAQVVRVSRELFFLDEASAALGFESSGRLGVRICDGLSWLERCAAGGRRYDAVLNDAFVGSVAPPELGSRHAAGLVHDVLEPGGVYLSNVVSAMEGADAGPLVEAASQLAGAFAHAWAVGLPDAVADEQDNLMLVACDEPLALPGAVGLF